MLEMEEAQFE
jgi:hypothetical protein